MYRLCCNEICLTKKRNFSNKMAHHLTRIILSFVYVQVILLTPNQYDNTSGSRSK